MALNGSTASASLLPCTAPEAATWDTASPWSSRSWIGVGESGTAGLGNRFGHSGQVHSGPNAQRDRCWLGAMWLISRRFHIAREPGSAFHKRSWSLEHRTVNDITATIAAIGS
jgi:hypothetical protein